MICRRCGAEFAVYRCTACPGAEVIIHDCQKCHRGEKHKDISDAPKKKGKKPLTKRRKRV